MTVQLLFSRICSKQHAASLFSARLVFSLGTLLKSRWFSHIVVLTRLQLRRILGLFHPRDHISR